MKTFFLGIFLFIMLGMAAFLQFSWLPDLQMREEIGLKNQLMKNTTEFISDLQDELFLLPILTRFRDEPLPEMIEKVCEGILYWKEHAVDSSLYENIYLVPLDKTSPILLFSDDSFYVTSSESAKKLVTPIQQSLKYAESRFNARIEFIPRTQEMILISPISYQCGYILLAQINSSILSKVVIPHFIRLSFDFPANYRFRITAMQNGNMVYTSDVVYREEHFFSPDISVPIVLDMQERLLRISAERFTGSMDIFYDVLKNRTRTLQSIGDFFDMKVQFMLNIVHIDGSIAKASRNATLGFSIGNICVLMLLALGMAVLLYTLHKAQKLSQRQNEFIATVTHELKTPIAVISSAAQNLSIGIITSPEKIAGYGKMIEKESIRLKNSIDYFLLYANINSSARLHFTSCNIIDVIQKALLQSEEKIQRLQFKTDFVFPNNIIFVHGDHIALQTVFHNMITNVLKHAQGGLYLGISVLLQKKNTVQICISDHGEGISYKEQKSIFEPFIRGTHAMKNQIEGNGIGLNLVKRIVTLHEGTVGIQESSFRGSTFCITLPVSAVDMQ